MSSSIPPSGASGSQPYLLQPFHIPPHLSAEAKQYLSRCEIAGGPIDDVSIFDLARKGFAEGTQATSDLAQAQYVDSIREEVIAGVPCGDVQIKSNPDAKNDRVVLYVHGGAFTLGSWKHLMQVFTPVAFHAGCSRVVAVDYRLASDINPYPAGLSDCVGVYRKLAEEVRAENIYILGDSAGGNLALRITQECPELTPAAIGLFSPLVSMEKVGGTWDNKPKISYELSLVPHMPYYAPGMEMSDPQLSPLYGKFSTRAPVKIHTGTLDPLEGQCKLFKETFPDAQIEVQVQDGIWHGVEEHDCPEGRSSTQSMGDFFRRFSTRPRL